LDAEQDNVTYFEHPRRVDVGGVETRPIRLYRLYAQPFELSTARKAGDRWGTNGISHCIVCNALSDYQALWAHRVTAVNPFPCQTVLPEVSCTPA
jgi:hypothetical protein